jgi:hypothetical protein
MFQQPCYPRSPERPVCYDANNAIGGHALASKKNSCISAIGPREDISWDSAPHKGLACSTINLCYHMYGHCNSHPCASVTCSHNGACMRFHALARSHSLWSVGLFAARHMLFQMWYSVFYHVVDLVDLQTWLAHLPSFLTQPLTIGSHLVDDLVVLTWREVNSPRSFMYACLYL